MSETTMSSDPRADLGTPATQTPAPVPHAEDEGLSRREIKWIPLVVPLAALTVLLVGASALSAA